ncbi:putative flavin-binding monooxygenase [Xylaria intraflava]|nr:putative flavin-binding monooxygenase [Xylaria intraflava]
MALGDSHEDSPDVETFDVLVVGAGVSGVNAAYRLQSQAPHATFAVLEGRGSVGGTWDLFRYPGVRSDSDLFTFGFQWEPWPYETPIAEGPLIREYMKTCIAKYNLDRYIRFHHKVTAADWSRHTQQWKVTAEHDGRKKEFRATWVLLGTGYYDYDNPLQTVIPGLEQFKGKIIHPQHWPEDYDHSGKKMVVIGSGATTVSLVPALAKTAEAVTIVQRSPSYVVSMKNDTPRKSWLMKYLSQSTFGTLLRIQWVMSSYISVLFCLYFPERARARINNMVKAQLPSRISDSPHFKPAYRPWEQRLCITPDGDFFRAFRENPNTNIVTGHIETVTESGLRMKDGTTIDADTIVTATGLYFRLGGGIEVTVDGEKVDWAGRLLWHGSMIQDVPNMMFSIGYVNASWTLGADDTALILTRLLNHMKSKGVTTAIPRAPPGGTNGTQRMWQLDSTYSKLAEKRLPIYGNVGPWRPKTSPPLDWLDSKWGNIVTGLHFNP